ncbi:hypothetical protein GCM10023183_01880 [Nibribacter koreensis]|uniref:Uncharacterized protein n=2 Tax=Nibribacter koreensis TaxID=1084519 RepID=A0ABP8F5R7_9BACT
MRAVKQTDPRPVLDQIKTTKHLIESIEETVPGSIRRAERELYYAEDQALKAQGDDAVYTAYAAVTMFLSEINSLPE